MIESDSKGITMKYSSACMAIATLALAGCGAGGATSMQWQQVGEHTTCEAADPSACSGRYGFTVDNQGNFVIGPNPKGSTIKGVLTTSELGQLTALANTLTADINVNPNPVCQAVTFAPGSSDVVGIAMATGQSFTLQDVLHGKCAFGGHTADTTALIDDLDQLRAKYYPSPF